MKFRPSFLKGFPSKHPNPRLQTPWNFAQWGLLIFPLATSVGAIGIAFALLSVLRRQYSTITQRRLNWGFAILGVWLLVSCSLSVNPYDAFAGLLGSLLPFFFLFAAFSVLIQTPNQLRQLAWILVLPSVPLILLGFGQLFWGWAAPHALQSIFGWMLEPQGSPVGRMASVFMHANLLGAYLQTIFILALGLWIEEFKTRTLRVGNFSSIYKIGFLSLVLMGCTSALILTNSRNAWGLTLLSCLAFAIYQGWRWLVAMVVGVAGSVLGAAYAPPPLQQGLRAIVPPYFWIRLTSQFYSDRPPTHLRVNQWKFAWWMTQQRPLQGWGLRSFAEVYEAHTQVWFGHPHNLFLMLSAETGIFTTLLLYGLVGWIMAQGVLLLIHYPSEEKQERLILFTYIVAFAGCTLFNLVDVTLFDLRLNVLFWLLLSAIFGVVYHKRAQ